MIATAIATLFSRPCLAASHWKYKWRSPHATQTERRLQYVTWAHHSLIEKNSQATQGLFFTVLLGIYFSILQAYEYIEAPFTIADSVYGSTFYIATGFYGFHVLIGTTF